MMTHETTSQLQALRTRMAQVADLQRQRHELAARTIRDTRPVDWALQLAKLDSTLRLARHSLAKLLRSLPEAERLQFIKSYSERTSSAPQSVTAAELGGSAARHSFGEGKADSEGS